MAYMTAPNGYAFGIDYVGELTAQAIKSIQNDNPELLCFNLFIVTGDGQSHDGYLPKALCDVIMWEWLLLLFHKQKLVGG